MIAFLIGEIDICGGTHKQFLKLLEYTEKQNLDFFIVTKKVNLEKTYIGFSKFKNKIRIFDDTKTLIGNRGAITRAIFTLRKLIKDADIINIHDNGFENYLPAFIGKKVVWQINDLPYVFAQGVNKNVTLTKTQKLIKKYISISTNVVDEITVNVSKNRDRVKSVFRRDSKVFYCGIESLDIEKNEQKSIERMSNNKLDLLTSGVFFPYRNYETQIEVVKKLIDKGIDVHLDIMGSTSLCESYHNKIQNLINTYKLEDRITIRGQVDDKTFKDLHKNADMFLFINIDQSWGLAVFEAMSCGLPVIVSESVGATEILHDGLDSIFVNPTDSSEIVTKIQSLMCNPTYYKSISTSAKELCKDFTWDNAYCSKMIKLFENM